MAAVSKFPSGNGTAIAGAWTNGTTGLNADDGTHASFTTTTKNDVRTLESGAVTFSSPGDIPAGATIDSVDVTVQEQVTSGGTLRVTPYLGATAGSANDNTTDTALTVRTYSGVARPGGGSWALADLTGGTLKVRVEGRQPNNTTSRTYQWDYVQVTVNYTAASAHSETPSDTLGLTDARTVSQGFGRSLADGLGLSDAQELGHFQPSRYRRRIRVLL